MAQNEDRRRTQRLPVTPEQEALIAETVDEILDADFDEQLPLVERHLQSLDRQEVGSAFETWKIVLQSLWNYLEALRLIMKEGDYVKAQELFQSATKEFGKVGQGELKDLSMALGLYSSGITELQRFNIGQGSKLLKKVKNYLRNAGKFGSKYETLIDHMEPDVFFVSGIQALQAYDYATGKTLIDKASQAAEHAARNYHKEGTPLYCKLQGMARLQQAYFTFFRALKEFNAFEYDKLAADRDLASDAIQAQELLDKANPEDIHVRKMNHLSKALVQLLEVIRELAKLMQTILHSTFKPDLQTLALFKEKIRKAINSLSEVGPHYVPFVRLCNQLIDQVNNLERLAKPSKKDFGAFSGIVACALFLPLFLAMSWANSVFEIGLDAPRIITSCLALALIGGFGFGALKFKSLISSLV